MARIGRVTGAAPGEKFLILAMLLFVAAGMGLSLFAGPAWHLPSPYASFRSADPRVRLLSSIVPQSMRDYGWHGHEFTDLGDRIGIAAPPARFDQPATLERVRKGGRSTWLLPDEP